MDIMGMMKQAAQLQQKMQDLQAELANVEVEGTAGGGLVRVTLTPKYELRSLSIDPSLTKPEEKGILEDLIVAAHADAYRKAEAIVSEKMRGIAGGLPLPPGLKLF